MPAKDDAFTRRSRKTEDDYFRKKEQELIEKLKEKKSREAARKDLSAAVGVTDEGILQCLEELGYDRDAVCVLHLFPLVAVAWADGEVSAKERLKIVEIARAWGIAEGEAADRKLREWLDQRPEEITIQRSLQVIRDIQRFRPDPKQRHYHDRILGLCEQVAEASGGFLGIGKKISPEERAAMERLARELSTDHPEGAKKIAGG